MVDVLVPICCGCILPIVIVLISAIKKMNSDNKRTEIILKAIESNKEVDTDQLLESLKAPRKSPREVLNGRLLRGCIFTLIGVAVAIVGIANLCTGSDFDSDPVTVPLIAAGICMAIGISFLIVYFVTRHQVDDTPADEQR